MIVEAAELYKVAEEKIVRITILAVCCMVYVEAHNIQLNAHF